MTIIRHRYSCMIGDDAYDVDAGTPWEAAVMAARQIGHRTARPAETIADGAGMRAFITDQGEIIDVAPRPPDDPDDPDDCEVA